MNPLRRLGRATLGAMRETGRFALFCGRAGASVFTPPFYGGQFLAQVFRIGWLSLPVIGLTAVFI